MDDKHYAEILRHLGEDVDDTVKTLRTRMYPHIKADARSLSASISIRLRHLLEVGWVRKLDEETPFCYCITTVGKAFLHRFEKAT